MGRDRLIPLCERTVIAGKYRLERELASGGMVAVWVARHLQLDAPAATEGTDWAAATRAPRRVIRIPLAAPRPRIDSSDRTPPSKSRRQRPGRPFDSPLLSGRQWEGWIVRRASPAPSSVEARACKRSIRWLVACVLLVGVG